MTNFTDSATVVSKSAISVVEVTADVESFTIATVTQIIPDDRGPFADATTVGSTTQITLGETEYVHPTGYWGPFDTDDGIL